MIGDQRSSNEPVAARRVRFVVAYHGASFHGFAANEGVRTVAGVLTQALSAVCRYPVELVGAGRTDAGVHAWGQVVSCDLPERLDLSNVMHRVNRMCGPELAVRQATWTRGDFNARFSAIWREYRYTVWNAPQPHPFLIDTAWHVHHPLSLAALQLSCDALIGERDFTSFCRQPPLIAGLGEPSMRRRVMHADWKDVTAAAPLADNDGAVLRFEIRANAFCHQMVRSLVGAMIKIGEGRLRPSAMQTMIQRRNRESLPTLAPPQGLMLWKVGYPPADQAHKV